MIDEMGIFRPSIELSPLHDHARRLQLHDMTVDTGSEYTWVPRGMLELLGVTPVRAERFETADGRILVRRELVPAGPVPIASSRAA